MARLLEQTGRERNDTCKGGLVVSEVHPTSSSKPNKPYPDFPLFPHATKRWAKKIRGQMFYFGPWADPDGALARYLEQAEALHAGRKPRLTPAAGVTVKELCNQFLGHKAALMDAGEIAPRTWDEYKAACDLIVSAFGKGRAVEDLTPDDFAGLRKRMTARWGPTTVGNTIQRVRSVFKFASDNDLVQRVPKYGQGFQRPSKKTLRIERAKRGARLFTPEEVRRLLDAAGVHLKAMIMLGVNCGYGNQDCGVLPLTAIDLDKRTLDHPRPKTGVARRCVLWPETVEALRESIKARPDPKKEEHQGLVFVTKYGDSWAKDAIIDSPVAKEFAKVMRKAGITGRKGTGFYTLRHTFRTVADEAKDQPAADLIMGHESSHMSTVYRERISDDRLRAVTDHVRRWLFAPPVAPVG